jgi:hypothetical protein
MLVQPMLVRSGIIQPKTIQPRLPLPGQSPHRTRISEPISRPENPPQNLSLGALLEKKLHFVWCKCNLTLLSSAYFLQSRVEKTQKNDQKSTLLAPFQSFFRFFWALLCSLFLPSLRPISPFFWFAPGVVLHPPLAVGVNIDNRPVRTPIGWLALTTKTGPIGPDFVRRQSLSRGSGANFVASPLFFSHSQRAQVCR